MRRHEALAAVLLAALAWPVSATTQAPAPAAVQAGSPAPATAPTIERVTLPPVAATERPSLLESQPAGWLDVQPKADLAGWVRGPWPATAELGPQQWSVDPATGHLVCDGKGGHEWLRYDRELGDVAIQLEWRFTPVAGADKYNSGVLVRTARDLATWHQAQAGGTRGFLFGLVEPARRVTQDAALARLRPAGEWNTYEIVARGRKLSLWVNGAVTNEIPINAERGYVGLEAEGWRIEFRNLRLKPLD